MYNASIGPKGVTSTSASIIDPHLNVIHKGLPLENIINPTTSLYSRLSKRVKNEGTVHTAYNKAPSSRMRWITDPEANKDLVSHYLTPYQNVHKAREKLKAYLTSDTPHGYIKTDLRNVGVFTYEGIPGKDKELKHNIIGNLPMSHVNPDIIKELKNIGMVLIHPKGPPASYLEIS